MEITHDNFEPGITTKSLWTYVRKKKTTIAGVMLPGLFQIAYFGIDAPLFFIALVLEWIGLHYIVVIGDISISYTLAGVLLDIAFAVGLHWFTTGKTCELQNKVVVAEIEAREAIIGEHGQSTNTDVDEMEEAIASESNRLKAAYRSQLSLRKAFSWLFASAIFALASMKIYIFYWLLEGDFNSVVLFILVSYVLVALLHIKVTGYFIFAVLAKLSLWLDERSFINNKQGALKPNDHNHKSVIETDIELIECQSGKHDVRKMADGSYELRTQGILTDSQLHTLISRQRSDKAKRELALFGLRRQLEILHTQLESSFSGTHATITSAKVNVNEEA